MKQENIKSMETLSLFCHLCGLFSAFIGIVVMFIDVLNGDMRHIQIGLYVFITGYAFVSISKKISNIIYSERT